ncbi:hypothetical protein SAMD00019534_105800, partial [Acytostelium subglobosum LB1]|uniref:hypothetical protein n=1 Tax=Acytostelium subglobosum LB1 TaxID=1410327 RepID=UPI0006450D0A
MNPAASIWWTIGGVSGALAICTGAFGGHGLKDHVKDPKKLDTWKTAANYHLIHSVALMLVPFSKHHAIAGPLLLGGTVLFSGSLYVLTLSDKKVLGAVTPLGGLAMIGGWLALAIPSI